MNSKSSVLLTALIVLAGGSTAFGQAWTPGKNKGTFAFQYQYMDVGDHLFSTSNLGPNGEDIGTDAVDFGQIESQVGVLDFDYGLTSKLALNANTAYVRSRYDPTGPNAFVENPAIDDGHFHGGLQDIRLTARYAIALGKTTLTPALGVQTALRDYPIVGHTAVGRGLDELQATLNVGRVFGAAMPRAYVQGSYSYALVETVNNVSSDRSVGFAEFGYFVTPRFNINVGTSVQETHGGLDWASDIHDEGDFHTHDQAAAANWVRAGLGVWFRVGAGGGMFVSVVDTIDGENTHEALAVTTGLSWRFNKGLRFVTQGNASLGPSTELRTAIAP